MSIFDTKEARKAARDGHTQACRDLDSKFAAGGPFDEGDPNHPLHSRLFGYDEAVFMAKQYPCACASNEDGFCRAGWYADDRYFCRKTGKNLGFKGSQANPLPGGGK
jgi:hypothetical protein